MKNGIKLILFMLVTGLSIGQYVTTTFDRKIFKVIDFIMITPFTKFYTLKTEWYKPITFVVILVNEYGGIETCGTKVINTIYESGNFYTNSDLNLF